MCQIMFWEELKAQRATLNQIQVALNNIQASLTGLGDDLKSTLARMETEEVKEFDTLTAQVAATQTIEQSAITLIQGISAQLKAQAVDPVAVQKLADDLSASAASMAAAISANTAPAPAPVPAPAPTPVTP